MRRNLILSATLLAAALPLQAQQRDSLSIERIFVKREFSSAPIPPLIWMRDGSSYTTLRSATGGGTDIILVDVPTGTERVLASGARLLDEEGERIEVEDIVFSADESQALLYHSSVQVWRQFTRGRYHVLDLRTGEARPLSTQPGLQMFAKFAPDGGSVAFVRENNLYLVELASRTERALTTDGSETIINGTTDWVYEEELDLRDAFRWSPDSRRIAFWRFDQSPVPQFPIVNELRLYPDVQTLRYPKAGQPNSRVRVGVLQVAGGEPTWLDVGPDTGIYIARMDWIGTDSLIIQRLPRRQNQIDLLMVSATSGQGRTVLTESDERWLEVVEQPTWIENGRRFIWASDRSGWRQYYLFDRSGQLVRRLTRDSIDVASFAGVDEQRDVIYVVEAAPLPRQRNLVRYTLRTGQRTVLTGPEGSSRASVAPGGRYGLVYTSTAGTPTVAALFDLPRMRGLRVLQENAELVRRMAATAMQPPQFFRIPSPADDSLNAWRILPPGFDSTRAYPVLMYVYGGPGSQTVTEAFGGERYLWHQLMAQRGYVVVSVDNRGTGARGREFMKQVYLRLGQLEAEDQIAAARWLAQQPWVDGSRIGIWGWSYGGYLSALAAGLGGNVFRAAVSVAPVTDWRLYDTIYTERFMWVPEENAEGYDAGAPLGQVENLSARLLLVHGTADDNVHAQHVIQYAERLQEAGKQFEMMLYPNRNHTISGGNTRAHLFEMITRFLEDRL